MNVSGVLKSREAALSLVIALLVAAIGWRAPVFVTPESLLSVVTDTSFLFMLTLAQMAVILTRGIDLSVAANLALTGMIVALISRAHPDIPIAVIMVLAVMIGLFLGCLNGAAVAWVGIPPIVVTLGTLAIFRGLIFVIAGGSWLTSKDMSDTFQAFPRVVFLGLSSLVWVAAVVSLAFGQTPVQA